MSETPGLPSVGGKDFWKKPEGNFGAFLTAAAIAGAGIFAFIFSDTILRVTSNLFRIYSR